MEMYGQVFLSPQSKSHISQLSLQNAGDCVGAKMLTISTYFGIVQQLEISSWKFITGFWLEVIFTNKVPFQFSTFYVGEVDCFAGHVDVYLFSVLTAAHKKAIPT